MNKSHFFHFGSADAYCIKSTLLALRRLSLSLSLRLRRSVLSHVCVCVSWKKRKFNFYIMTSKLNQVDMKTICTRQFQGAFVCAPFRTKRSGNSQ